MKTMRMIIVVGLVCGVTVAQEVTPPADGTTVPVAPVLNAAQQQKVDRLSEASGVSAEQILQMRTGTPVVPVDPVGGVTTPTGPQGHGWGLIARLLGLHPGILGNGTGDKFMPVEEEGAGDLLQAREQKRERLDPDTESGKVRAHESGGKAEAVSKREERDLDRDRDKGRDGSDRNDRSKDRDKESRGRGPKK